MPGIIEIRSPQKLIRFQRDQVVAAWYTNLMEGAGSLHVEHSNAQPQLLTFADGAHLPALFADIIDGTDDIVWGQPTARSSAGFASHADEKIRRGVP